MYEIMQEYIREEHFRLIKAMLSKGYNRKCISDIGLPEEEIDAAEKEWKAEKESTSCSVADNCENVGKALMTYLLVQKKTISAEKGAKVLGISVDALKKRISLAEDEILEYRQILEKRDSSVRTLCDISETLERRGGLLLLDALIQSRDINIEQGAACLGVSEKDLKDYIEEV